MKPATKMESAFSNSGDMRYEPSPSNALRGGQQGTVHLATRTDGSEVLSTVCRAGQERTNDGPLQADCFENATRSTDDKCRLGLGTGCPLLSIRGDMSGNSELIFANRCRPYKINTFGQMLATAPTQIMPVTLSSQLWVRRSP